MLILFHKLSEQRHALEIVRVDGARERVECETRCRRTSGRARARCSEGDRGSPTFVSIDELDLGVPTTIDAFAARFGDRPLGLLVNNAGIMAAPLSRDARGLESQLVVNHVGHFRLFARLLPALRRARGTRVVALSSRGHVRSAFDFEAPASNVAPTTR